MRYLKLTTLFSCLLLVAACHPKKNTPYTSIDYSYPTDSTTITKWITNNNFTAMYKHSWSIWQHITNPIENGKLEYQVWTSPTQIIKKLNNSPNTISSEVLFEKPRQFTHGTSKLITDDTDIVVTVGYNKASEKYALDKKIFYLSSLKEMQQNPYSSVTEFPSDAINIKPVYKIITKNKLYDGIYTMGAWNGPKYFNNGYPEKKWESCIHININEKKSNLNGSLDYDCNDINRNNTFYLDDFIHFKISRKQSDSYNTQIKEDLKAQLNIKSKTRPSKSIKEKFDSLFEEQRTFEGDIAILVAMHVTTKEIKRWTWQTYWWSPTPFTPHAPSSNSIASSKHGIKLKGAANHYAMATAYSMLIPSQPYENGKNEGEPVIAFNPYLEAHFGNSDLEESTSYLVNNGNKITTNLGVSTNCMSCHMLAAINTDTGNSLNGFSSPKYQGDTYTSYKDSIFKKRLMLDFAWSIQGNIVSDK